MKKVISLILVVFIAGRAFSQDTLPKFTLTERGDKVTISWKNPYLRMVQLNVQRSYDSLKNFSTVYSATSPELPQNGYTDPRPATSRTFYRIFYVLEGGSYFFTRSKRATGATSVAVTTTDNSRDLGNARDLTNGAFNNVVPGDKRIISIKIKDSIFKKLSVNAFRSFRDSIVRQTKDTIYSINDSVIGVSPYVVVEVFKTSSYIYITRDGYINVSVPQVNEKKYNVKFFEENGTALFEIQMVKESPLILDKSNFIHSGWFLFELYEDNKLKEKNRLFVPKEF
ncbi:hypothetical protein [Segetibacter sp.]|uniref:hypothetical protein n=1 Tax=Segetibacter sp. TaxID=2231182 RepID=UPI0026191C6D|nr:hypothetical protein [Segetibacter sp.]MCW3080953.1 hypothetical protein [Segetibacter sp.]